MCSKIMSSIGTNSSLPNSALIIKFVPLPSRDQDGTLVSLEPSYSLRLSGLADHINSLTHSDLHFHVLQVLVNQKDHPGLYRKRQEVIEKVVFAKQSIGDVQTGVQE